ncbi:hypothetical protein CEE45_05140 [Candidatus Heimdallarchaeota archaeon B3_Heim]|nr:MAG: hypothetical protein CEE45_05140 [Candidatus Heimdallarchaeota archaeon B3_Heim]
MSKAEVETKIELIQKRRKKTINIAFDKSQKTRKAIQKHRNKIIEDTQKLIDETDPQLTEEGVQKITKKGKIYFRSLKAFNPLLHVFNTQVSKLKIPDEKKQLTSSELNQFVRNLSRLVNDINKEKAQVDAIMGLDFLLKKRGIYAAFAKITSELNDLRDLQKEEYSVVKAIEDLESIIRDIENIQVKTEQLKEEKLDLEVQLKVAEESRDNKEDIRTALVGNPIISNSRQRGIRITEIEIEMGTHLNSFKKKFKKYAREVQRGSVSGEFGLVNTALSYEKNPVQKFLDEPENNPEISALLEELINVGEKSLHLKQKDLSNLSRALKNIQEGKFDLHKKEWHDLHKKKNEDDASSEFKKVNGELIECESEIKDIEEKISGISENISLKSRELLNLSESLENRQNRSLEITEEVINHP